MELVTGCILAFGLFGASFIHMQETRNLGEVSSSHFHFLSSIAQHKERFNLFLHFCPPIGDDQLHLTSFDKILT
ncbi:hypothetical protein QVD17_00591 [Tagetes erecta]|uniref:Uncharacterized protein n=1 Tax=Tagetes erecta TaxID=13708 RepID=A0AAD8P7C3_TARER|nr:hypothetical protein QVD17_00591 [Tagetes erecta]